MLFRIDDCIISPAGRGSISTLEIFQMGVEEQIDFSK